MNVLGKIIALGALSVIAACSNNDPSALGGGAGGSGAIAPGSPSDPRSPAYFQQTIGDRVLFAVDQSTLTPQAQSVLQGQADWLMANWSAARLKPRFSATATSTCSSRDSRRIAIPISITNY